MPKIDFQPANRILDAPSGSDLLVAAKQADVEIELPCGGEGSCGRCIVRVAAGEVDSDSIGLLPGPAVAAGYVLACRTRIGDGPVTIEVADPLAGVDGQFAEEGAGSLVDASLLPQPNDVEPLVVRRVLQVPPPKLEDGLSDVDRLSRAIRDAGDSREVAYSLGAMRVAAEALRDDDGRVTVTAVGDPGFLRVVHVEAEDVADRHFGIAVDVGTTSVAVQLVDLGSGRVLATRSDYNAQIPCGIDVISRINYAARPERLEELRTRVLRTVNALVCDVAFACRANPAEICDAVVSGNTVMTHLLLGLPPEHIRLDPYTPTVREPPRLAAAEVGLCLRPDAPVRLSPCVGSYVGGDITAGLLCSDLATGADGTSLFVDIGTNGEIVVGGPDFLMACACSAGPAFEGGGIACGMRAATGAIDAVTVDADSGRPTCRTVGGAPPRGICGSGLVDLLANLLRTGWIDRRGGLDRSRASEFVEVDGKRARYVLVPAEKSATGRPISLGETEIENVIRAKAAIYSASALLLDRIGASFSSLRRIYIAGSFGRFLDLDQAVTIGMVPDVPRERFRYLGNASLTGSYMALVSRRHRRRQIDLARRITYVELSTEPSYMDQYTAALFLPHTDLGLFPTVAAALGTRAEFRVR